MNLRYTFRPLCAVVALAAALSNSGCGADESSGDVPVLSFDSGLRRADSLTAFWVGEERVASAVLLVSRRGEIVLQQAYGWSALHEYGEGQYGAWAGQGADGGSSGGGAPGRIRRLDALLPVTANTVFDLASVTKVMATTFAVMLLVERGALDLDLPLHRYLSGFRGKGLDRITPRHLLTHRSGLQQWQPIYYSASGPDEAYRAIRDLAPGWPTGEGRHYSDLGFMLLGRLVETVSGKSLSGFLSERLYAPLGLVSTGFRPRQNAALPPDASFAATSHGNPFEYRMVHDSTFGYRYPDDPNAWTQWRRYTLVGEVNDGNAFHAFGGTAGHAGLFSTAPELQVLLQLLLNQGVYGGQRYLSGSVVDEFLAPTGDGQALGWQVPDNAPPGSFSHTGFTGTFVLGVPRDQISVVLLTNRQNMGVDEAASYTDVDPLRRAVVEALFARDR